MRNVSTALFVIHHSAMVNSMRKTIMLIAINIIINSLASPVLNVIKPSLMVLPSPLLINTGTEITSPAPNVTNLSPTKSSSKMRVFLTAKNTITKEEVPFVESVTKLLMVYVFLPLIKSGIKIVSLVLVVMVF